VKLFFVLVFFLFFIALFAGGALGDTDLTPHTPPDPNRPVTNFSSPAGASGVCGSVYTVRSGDTLSSIARACGITLENLLAANPAITNPNLIHVDQRVNIPGGSASQPQPAAPAAPVLPGATAVQGVRSQGADAPATAPTDAYLDAFRIASDPNNAKWPTHTPVPPKDMQPGAVIDTSVQGLYSNTPVRIGISKVGQEPVIVGEGVSRADGSFFAQVMIPLEAKAGEDWVVTFMQDGSPPKSIPISPFKVQ
jgi:hypothetical protein